MLAWLLATMRDDKASGAGPFTITGVNLSVNQAGTSCGNPLKFNVSLAYTGVITGKTCMVERDFNGEGFTTVATGVAVSAFPYLLSVAGYYNKFGTSADTVVRVTDEATLSNTGTSTAYATTYNLCS